MIRKHFFNRLKTDSAHREFLLRCLEKTSHLDVIEHLTHVIATLNSLADHRHQGRLPFFDYDFAS